MVCSPLLMPQTSSMTRVVILGGGKDGTTLLELFARSSSVDVVGMADADPDAPGLRLAQSLGIRTSTDALALVVEDRADLIVDVTGDPAMGPLIIRHKPPHAELLGGTLALLIWELTAQYERDLREQLIQAEKLATVGTLAWGIAHEINNPLYIISGLAEHLRNETRPQVINELADAIIHSAKRIARIVQDVNAFARKPPVEGISDVDLNDTLEEALKAVQKDHPLAGVQIIRQYSTLPPVRCKPEDMVQVFVNLINNAAHAMDGRGTLTLSTVNAGRYVHVIVRDNGPGIPPANLNKIFDPFFTTKEPGEGTGLGLYVVRDIVNLYHGYVTADNALGQGAAFTIKLPVAFAQKDRPTPTEDVHSGSS